MREADVEKYLHKKVTEAGGTTRKWVSPGRAGVPDRICFFPGGRIIFVEVKTDTGKTSVRQDREIETLRGLGNECHVVYGISGVDAFIGEYWA